MLKEHDMEAVILTTMIDNHFIQFLESKETTVKFSRVDADLSESMKETDNSNEAENKEMAEKLEKLFKEALGDDKLKVQVESLKSSSVPGMILLSEFSRRFQEMSRMYGGGMNMGMFPQEHTLVLNKNNSLIQSIVKLQGRLDKTDDVNMMCQHVFDLAMLSHKQLEPEAMTKFIERSNVLLARLAELE